MIQLTLGLCSCHSASRTYETRAAPEPLSFRRLSSVMNTIYTALRSVAPEPPCELLTGRQMSSATGRQPGCLRRWCGTLFRDSGRFLVDCLDDTASVHPEWLPCVLRTVYRSNGGKAQTISELILKFRSSRLRTFTPTTTYWTSNAKS